MTGFGHATSRSTIRRSAPRPILDVPIRRKDEHSLTELHIDVGQEAQNFGAGDLADLFIELLATLRNERLLQPFDHFDPSAVWPAVVQPAEDSLQPANDLIPCHNRLIFVGPTPQEPPARFVHRCQDLFHTSPHRGISDLMRNSDYPRRQRTWRAGPRLFSRLALLGVPETVR